MSEFDQCRLIELAALSAILFLGAILFRNKTFQTSRFGLIGVCFFFTLGLLSCTRADFVYEAICEWALLLSLTTCTGLAAIFFFPKSQKIATLNLIAFLGVFSIVTPALVNVILGWQNGERALIETWWLPFGNVRFASQLLVWCLPITAAASRSKPLYRWIALVVGMCGWTVIFWSGGRGGLLALASGSLLCFTIVRTLAMKSVVKIMAIHSLLGTIGFIILNLHFGNLTSVNEGYSLLRSDSSGRVELWGRSLEIIKAHPWFGIGPMQFAETTNSAMSAHPHNALLQIASEWGLPACIIFFTLWWRIFRSAYNQLNTANIINISKINENLNASLLISIISAGILAMVDGVIVMPLSQLAAVFVVGGILSNNIAANRQKSNFVNLGSKFIALIGFFAMVPIAAYVSNYKISDAKQTELSTVICDYKPRFWADGHLPERNACFHTFKSSLR